MPPTPQRQQQQRQEDLKLLPFAAVQGMDTREERSGIAPGFWSWLMNVQPIGQRTLRVLNGKGPTLYTAPGGDSILWYGTCVIGTAAYLIVFLASGKADQVAISGGAVTHISSSANTFYNGSGAFPHFTAFGNSGIVIVSPLGYWAWDGTTLFAAGSAAPTWLSGSTPSFPVTGTATHGSAILTGIASVSGIIVGEGITGTGFAAGTTVSNINSASEITLSNTFSGSTGSEVITVNPLSTTGSTNTSTVLSSLGMTVNIQVGMTVTDSLGDIPAGTLVNGITSTTEIAISNAATNSHSVDAFTFAWDMPTGVEGTAIEIYNASPWIVNGRTIIASAPGNGANFATSAGGVSLTVKDAYVQSGYTGIKQLDGFLYLFAPSAVDVISDVQTSGSPPSTTFLRVNVSERVGTPWRDTVQALPSSIGFANPAGTYEVAGGQARKVSDYADGLFEDATFSANPCALIVTLNEVTCYGVTMALSDPDTDVSANDIALWDGRRWFIASQETQPTIVATQDLNSQQIGWGSDGTTIFELFNAASDTLTKKAKSWFSPGDLRIIDRKQVQRVYAQFGNTPPQAIIFSEFNIDTETTSVAAGTVSSGLVTWLNDNEQLVTWLNNSDQIVLWNTNTFPLVTGAGAAVIGLILGVTVETTSATLDIIGLYLGYVEYSVYD